MRFNLNGIKKSCSRWFGTFANARKASGECVDLGAHSVPFLNENQGINSRLVTTRKRTATTMVISESNIE